jgi:hypothetical protein
MHCRIGKEVQEEVEQARKWRLIQIIDEASRLHRPRNKELSTYTLNWVTEMPAS